MKTPEKAPEKAEPAAAAPAPVITEAPAAPKEAEIPVKAEKPEAKPEKKPEPKPAKAEAKPAAKPAKKAEPKGAKPTPPADRKALEAMVAEQGVDAAIEALSKAKVVALRALAREFNGEFGIAGREIRNANKKVLIEEFKAFFKK